MPRRAATPGSERLPQLVDRKLYKTGQTRGATPSEIYQNRVLRNSTVLIPHELYEKVKTPDEGTNTYENGFIVLVRPDWYFQTNGADAALKGQGLELGVNAILLFERRSEWTAYAPGDGRLPGGKAFLPATRRISPLGGTYMARIHSTTAKDGAQIFDAFNEAKSRGAGIRVWEYASSEILRATRIQLEALIWQCQDSISAFQAAGMTELGAQARRRHNGQQAVESGLLDWERLQKARMVDDGRRTICPLCLERISAADLLKRGEQAEGRETYDITITEISLFHIEELRVGKLQHKPYNLGWGHHFCNVVVKDAGIIPTLRWMKRVLDNNGDSYEAIDREAALVEEAIKQ